MPVSVIIPNFNAGAYIERSLRSVLDDPATAEAIVVDDGSSDGSPDLVRAIGDPRIRLIVNERNMGASRSRHAGVAASRTELLCFVDADDFLSPGAISAGAGDLAARSLDLSVFDMVRVDAQGLEPSPFVTPPAGPIDGVSAFLLTLGGWAIHPMGVFRKSLYLRATGDVSFHGYSDDELIGRRILLASRSVGGNAGRYFYRLLPKAPRPHSRIGQVRTATEVLRLAAERVPGYASHPRVIAQRNDLTAALLGLAVHALHDRAYAAPAAEAAAAARGLGINWRLRDARFAAMALAAPLVRLAATAASPLIPRS
jgi:glycosyltransferase involved in cell wall biosynthesis